MQRQKTDPAYIPAATYRLQLNRLFTFEMSADLVGYLNDLGITDIYASPFLMARPGSLYGYDVTDHSRLNPEIGDMASFLHLSGELKRRGMGLILDIVPNHMCITDPSNWWWWDVLENGPSSHYSKYFDIEWHPPKSELSNRVLLPVLGDQYGRVLENQQIQIRYKEGSLAVDVNGMPLPLAPLTWPAILGPAVQKLRDYPGVTSDHLGELESIVTALNHLPGITETDDAKLRERQREKDIVRRRLSTLVEASPEVGQAIEASIREINGEPGNARSFDRLDRLLDGQAYRLSFWRVAVDEINYRRFFDINDLAAIRVEDPEVFEAVHGLIFEFVRDGHITGLRVDHPDGLAEPERYFRHLQEAGRLEGSAGKVSGAATGSSLYVVAEKILGENEPLRTSWAIEGTTGYEFLNYINDLFVDRSKEKSLRQTYRRFTGWTVSFGDLLCNSKRIILQVAMSSELNVLAGQLDHISEQHRYTRDFTLENLRDAVREVLVAFSVYRTYIAADDKEVSPEDRRQITLAIREAKRRNAAISESVFDFIQDVLLLRHPDGLDAAQRAERHAFAMRFQQISAPVMAKGVEDTAFYNYYPLASLNEVGGDPQRFGISVTEFHRRNSYRQQVWPNSMNASSTHDSKRSEDVRTRIDVLSEIPETWDRAIRRWRGMNEKWKHMTDDEGCPDANEEYLLYQTLVGTWPLEPMDVEAHAAYVQRIQAYMEKATREAKIHTSWINPNAAYETSTKEFVGGVLNVSENYAFIDDFSRFQAPITSAGSWNSISQVLLKITSPGVPDFYQGEELWCLDLVDPDNRKPVDFALRRTMLATLRAAAAHDLVALAERLSADLCDGALKMHVTSRALSYRRTHKDLFSKGIYIPLTATGARAENVIAYSRRFEGQTVIVIAGRFFVDLIEAFQSVTAQAWEDTAIVLPRKLGQQRFEDALTGKAIHIDQAGGRPAIPLREAFSCCPVALLMSRS